MSEATYQVQICGICHDMQASGTLKITYEDPSTGDQRVMYAYPVCNHCYGSLFGHYKGVNEVRND